MAVVLCDPDGVEFHLHSSAMICDPSGVVPASPRKTMICDPAGVERHISEQLSLRPRWGIQSVSWIDIDLAMTPAGSQNIENHRRP